MNISTEIEKTKKGCGKEFTLQLPQFEKGHLTYFVCGEEQDKLYLCPTCQALLEQAQEFEKIIEDKGLKDIIDFLDNLKNLRIDKQSSLNYEDGELPFGTCDYMAIDDMICKLKELLKEVQGEGK